MITVRFFYSMADYEKSRTIFGGGIPHLTKYATAFVYTVSSMAQRCQCEPVEPTNRMRWEAYGFE